MSEDFESPILDKLADRLTTILRRAYPTSLAVKELAGRTVRMTGRSGAS